MVAVSCSVETKGSTESVEEAIVFCLEDLIGLESDVEVLFFSFFDMPSIEVTYPMLDLSLASED